MKILLLGSNGQLGRELSRSLPSVCDLKSCNRDVVDLTDPRSIIQAIDEFKPDVIVNAAAYTAVDKAESEPELAFKINSEAVGILAVEVARRDIFLIHYSTDYVFDGTKTEPYHETDVPNPINVYGASKLAGEQAITASGCKHLIFRTTWIIGSDGNNFAKTILRLAMSQDALNVINDQYGVPTSPVLITMVTVNAVRALKNNDTWLVGIYNLVPKGETNWFELAQTLLTLAGDASLKLKADETTLNAIKSVEFPTVAKRPSNSLLSTIKLQRQIRSSLPHWKDDFSVTATQIVEEFKTP